MLSRKDLSTEANIERRRFWEMCAERGPQIRVDDGGTHWGEDPEDVASWADWMLIEWDKRWIAEEIESAAPEPQEIRLLPQADSLCPDCGMSQFICPSGLICENGHGY